jgi:hypothetical protein
MGGSSLKRSSPAAWKRTLAEDLSAVAGQEITHGLVTAVTDCHLWVRDNKAPLVS